MSTVIYPSPIFGPVHSRRLGVSLESIFFLKMVNFVPSIAFIANVVLMKIIVPKETAYSRAGS